MVEEVAEPARLRVVCATTPGGRFELGFGSALARRILRRCGGRSQITSPAVKRSPDHRSDYKSVFRFFLDTAAVVSGAAVRLIFFFALQRFSFF